ncbi:hypothetical protein SEVIR_6G160200v4 [Setaria viridis]|uniref:Uncharacterized protein n=2 Tax=Setaria TaxID=4554 RepID=A0A368RM21_SETIT|nr:hypothetical protein SETIT_6G154100v2 [Setaria italica]TKW10373.1 hypothetical protein SEVIR_6G160200v2 [Setaria viridis]
MGTEELTTNPRHLHEHYRLPGHTRPAPLDVPGDAAKREPLFLMASAAHVLSSLLLVWFQLCERLIVGRTQSLGWATPTPNILSSIIMSCVAGDLIFFLCVEVARGGKGRLTLLHGWHCHLATPNSGDPGMMKCFHIPCQKGLTAKLNV